MYRPRSAGIAGLLSLEAYFSPDDDDRKANDDARRAHFLTLARIGKSSRWPRPPDGAVPPLPQPRHARGFSCLVLRGSDRRKLEAFTVTIEDHDFRPATACSGGLRERI